MSLHIGKHRNSASQYFDCSECDFSGDTDASLESHVQNVHSQNFKIEQPVVRLERLPGIGNYQQNETIIVTSDLDNQFDMLIDSSPEPGEIQHDSANQSLIYSQGNPMISESDQSHWSAGLSIPDFAFERSGTHGLPGSSENSAIASDREPKKLFQCDECAYATPKQSLLERHIPKHLIDPSYVCIHCGFKEPNSIKFSKHLTKHSSGGNFSCCFCSYTSPSLRNLTFHLDVHRPVQMTDCPECEMTFTRNTQLNKHLLIKHGKSSLARKNKFELGSKIKKLKRKDAFGTSIGTVDGATAPNATYSNAGFIPSIGSSPPSSSMDLQISDQVAVPTKEEIQLDKPADSANQSLTPSQDNTMTSESDQSHWSAGLSTPDFAFERSGIHRLPGSSENASISTGREPKKLFKCDKCAYATPKQSLLERHIPKHLIDPSFLCTHCGFKEPNAFKFSKHLAKHSSGGKFSCCFCSYSSVSLRNLTFHVEVHRPVQIMDCPECEMTFTRNTRLNKHLRMKHGKSSLVWKNKFELGSKIKKLKRKNAFRTSISIVDGATAPNASYSNAGFIPSIGSFPPSSYMDLQSSDQVAVPTKEEVQHREPSSFTDGVAFPAKPLYQCSSCTFSTKRKKILKKHVSKHLLPGSRFSCPKCEFVDSFTPSFAAHIMTHQSKEDRLNCCFCGHVFAQPKLLRRHFEVHRAVHFYDCPECGKTYSNFNSLRKHCAEVHVKNVQCPDCGKVMTGDKLPNHRLRHRDEGVQMNQQQDLPEENMLASLDDTSFNLSVLFLASASTSMENPSTPASFNLPAQMANLAHRCSLCDYGTNNKSLFCRHIAKHDSDEAKFTCPTCLFVTSDAVLFGTHLSTHYEYAVQYTCCFCSTPTKGRSNLIRHLETHRSIHFHDCPLCERSYTSLSSVSGHYYKCHVVMHECKDCGESMAYADLLEHGKIHGRFGNHDSAAANKLDYSDDPSILHCHCCDYRTAKKSLLRRHVVKHLLDTRLSCSDCNFKASNARDFAKHCVQCQRGLKCSECTFSTLNLRYLTSHVETHRNELIYDCTKCEMSCSVQRNLREHFKKMHLSQHQCLYCDKTMTRYELNHHKAKHLASLKMSTSDVTSVTKPEKSGFSYDTRSSFDKAAHAVIGNVDIKLESDVSPPRTGHLLCKYCGFTTDVQSLLEEHMAGHVSNTLRIKTEPILPKTDSAQQSPNDEIDDGSLDENSTHHMTANHQIKVEPILLPDDHHAPSNF